MSKIILPINEKPSITSYVHYSYLSAIVENDQLLDLFFQDSNVSRWKTQNTDIKPVLDSKEKTLRLLEHPERDSSDFYMSRICEDADEIVICVKDIRIVHNLTYIQVSFSQEETAKEDSWPLFVKWNQYDINMNETLIKEPGHLYMYYKFQKEGNLFRCSISKDQQEWKVLYARKHETPSGEPWYLHFHFFTGKNQYKQWKNMNFIQLFYNPKDNNTVYLDYYLFPRKGWDASYQCMCNFIDTEYHNLSRIPSYHQKIAQYIKEGIDQGYYMNTNIDEYYVIHRKEYGKNHYYHYNLFYGYDDEKEEFYILGYNENGKLELTPIPYSIVDQDRCQPSIVRYRYCMNIRELVFNIRYMAQLIREYVENLDSGLKYANLMGQREGIFGIKLFEELENSEEGRYLLLTDRRIAFVLYEHCRLMKDRMNYLEKNGYVRENAVEYLQQQCEEMLEGADILKNTMLRNQHIRTHDERVIDCLHRLYELEQVFYHNLLDYLIIE